MIAMLQVVDGGKIAMTAKTATPTLAELIKQISLAVPTRSSRAFDAAAIVNKSGVEVIDQAKLRYAVASSRSGGYVVTGDKCACPDFVNRGQACKHIIAVALYMVSTGRWMRLPAWVLPGAEGAIVSPAPVAQADDEDDCEDLFAASAPPRHPVDAASRKASLVGEVYGVA